MKSRIPIEFCVMVRKGPDQTDSSVEAQIHKALRTTGLDYAMAFVPPDDSLATPGPNRAEERKPKAKRSR